MLYISTDEIEISISIQSENRTATSILKLRDRVRNDTVSVIRVVHNQNRIVCVLEIYEKLKSKEMKL